MAPNEVNCKGYVLFKLGLVTPEKFVSIPTVEVLFDWFQETALSSAVAIALIRGNRSDVKRKKYFAVEHMLYFESDGTLSNREDIDYPITYTTLLAIQEAYLDDRGLRYFMPLSVKKNL